MKKLLLYILIALIFIYSAVLTVFLILNWDKVTNKDSKQIEDTSEVINNSLWDNIKETTWWKNNESCGETIVFYEDYEGNPKCIFMENGSGVNIVSRRWCEFDLIDEENVKIDGVSYKLNRDLNANDYEDKTQIFLFTQKALVYNHVGLADMDFVRSKNFIVEDINLQEDKIKTESISAEIKAFIGVDENGQGIFHTIKLTTNAPIGTEVIEDKDHPLKVFEPKCFVNKDSKLCVVAPYEAFPADFAKYEQMGNNSQFGTLYKVYVKNNYDWFYYTNSVPKTGRGDCSNEAGFTTTPPCGETVVKIADDDIYFQAECYYGEAFCDALMKDMSVETSN